MEMENYDLKNIYKYISCCMIPLLRVSQAFHTCLLYVYVSLLEKLSNFCIESELVHSNDSSTHGCHLAEGKNTVTTTLTLNIKTFIK